MLPFGGLLHNALCSSREIQIFWKKSEFTGVTADIAGAERSHGTGQTIATRKAYRNDLSAARLLMSAPFRRKMTLRTDLLLALPSIGVRTQ